MVAAVQAPAEHAPRGGAPAPSTSRLRHEPALDGLRGLAVAAVVVFHLGHLRGGFLGVDLFFVLSGFLITSLLVAERGAEGRIDLRAFWVRRARRLLPALLTMLAGVAVLLATLTPVSDRPRFRGEILATLGYVANWHRMSADVSYWDIFSQPSPLDHTWSLAIEEQFYVVWPVLALVVLALGAGSRRGVRLLGAVSAVGAVLSLGLLAAAYSPIDTNRAYFGTDTRLGPTLLGAALAASLSRRARRDRPPSPRAELAGALALAWIGWSVLAVDGHGWWYYRGGLVTFALAAAVVIALVTAGPGGLLARALSLRPLVGLGVVSYGVYLWHWPVIVYLTADRAHVDSPVLDALQVAVTLTLAYASYRLVEQPIRRGALQGRTAALVTVGALVGVAAVTVVVTRGPTASAGEAGLAPTGDRPLAIDPDDDAPADATRVLLVGDSGPIFLGPELVEEAGRGNGVVAAMSSQLLCTPVAVGGRMRFPDGGVEDRPECTDTRHEEWDDAVDRAQPDVVLYYLANAGGLGEGLIDDQWVADCDAAYDAYLEDALLEDLEILGAEGATVVVATSPYVDIPTAESRARVDCRNATYRRVVDQVPGARIVDLNAFVAAETAASGGSLLRDFVHLDHEVATRVARWLVPQIPAWAAPG